MYCICIFSSIPKCFDTGSFWGFLCDKIAVTLLSRSLYNFPLTSVQTHRCKTILISVGISVETQLTSTRYVTKYIYAKLWLLLHIVWLDLVHTSALVICGRLVLHILPPYYEDGYLEAIYHWEWRCWSKPWKMHQVTLLKYRWRFSSCL